MDLNQRPQCYENPIAFSLSQVTGSAFTNFSCESLSGKWKFLSVRFWPIADISFSHLFNRSQGSNDDRSQDKDNNESVQYYFFESFCNKCGVGTDKHQNCIYQVRPPPQTLGLANEPKQYITED